VLIGDPAWKILDLAEEEAVDRGRSHCSRRAPRGWATPSQLGLCCRKGLPPRFLSSAHCSCA
jgi:hypothetical protein